MSTLEPPHHSGMDRRRSLLTSLAGALAAPLAVEAQPPKRVRIAILSTGNPRSAAIFQAFEQRLRELGYIEGQNLVVEFRNAEGRTERLPSFAAEFVRLKVDLVVVATDPATRAVKEASAKLPIVMLVPDNAPELRPMHDWLDSWYGLGLVVAGMTHQGGDVQLTAYAARDWRANFFPVGIAHSVVGGTAWEPTPWRAVQRVAWEALQR